MWHRVHGDATNSPAVAEWGAGRLVPLPRPLPARSSRRGENCTQGRRSGTSTEIELRPRAPPSRGLSPPNCRGERGIRSCCGRARREGRAPTGLAPLAHLPQKRLGEVGCCRRITDRRTALNWRPTGGPSPDPSPLVPRGEGRIRSRSGRSVASPFPHALYGGRTGNGGAHHLVLTDPKLTAACPTSTSPGSFGGGGPVVPARRGPAPERPKRPTPCPHINLPQSFLGEVGGWCPPGGGARPSR
jgi:hypothetical protein